MAITRLILPLALTLLVISPTYLAQHWGELPFFPTGENGRQQPRLTRAVQSRIDCQIDQLSANEPIIRYEAEAGVTEVWDPNQQKEFQCVGVTVVRHEIEPRGLLLPHYHNAPSVSYLIRGQALFGVSIPGCPDTFESGNPPQSYSSESRRSERGSENLRDQHQKIRRVREGHVFALPAGASRWVYNDGDDRLTIVTLYDTFNYQNQLDDNLRSFFLAGNPQGRGGDQGRQQQRHQQSIHGRQSYGQNEGQNILSGFDNQLLAQAFDVEPDIIQSIQGQDDNRGCIVRVEGDFQMMIPEWDREEQGQSQRQQHRGGRGYDREGRGGRGYDREGRGGRGYDREGRGGRGYDREGRGGRGYDREGRGGRGYNGIEETLCSARLGENINEPQKADIFNPQAGRLTSLNSHKLPILNYLQLSAEKVNLYQNAIMAPNWKTNAHSIVYFTKGNGRVQIACQEGRLVFDDMVQEGQLLVVPQNFVILKKAGREGLEWVAFLTNDEAMTSPLAGRTSAIRGMPLEVVMTSYGLSRDEARQLKCGRQELSLFSPSERSQRGQQYAIV